MARLTGWLIVCLALLASSASVLAADDTQGLLEADRAMFSQKDNLGLAMLLDSDFTWTTAEGVTLTRAQALEKTPKLLLGFDTGNKRKETIRETHIYGDVGTVEQTIGRAYVLRVWVKRPAGWRALVYHEVRTQPAPLTPGKEATADAECVNPCKQVPFQPKNATEREVIQSYQAVERAVTAHDPTAWGTHIADEFFAVTSNSDKPLDKATRMAGLANQKQGGIAPFPLLSARMFVFGDTVVMTSKQQPVNGPPLRVTRVWIRRNGRWVESISYQTTVAGG